MLAISRSQPSVILCLAFKSSSTNQMSWAYLLVGPWDKDFTIMTPPASLDIVALDYVLYESINMREYDWESAPASDQNCAHEQKRHLIATWLRPFIALISVLQVLAGLKSDEKRAAIRSQSGPFFAFFCAQVWSPEKQIEEDIKVMHVDVMDMLSYQFCSLICKVIKLW